MDEATMTPVSPATALNHLAYLDEHQILVCLICKTGVRPGNSSKRHLRESHLLKGQPLKDAVSYISTLQLADPHTVHLPANGSYPIPELGQPLAGFHCQTCNFLTRSRKKVDDHGRNTQHQKEPESWGRVALQTFSASSYARYWIVDDGQARSTKTKVDLDEGLASTLVKYQATYDEKRAERRRIADDPSGIENISTWVRETKWAEHFAGKDVKAIHLASIMPRPKDVHVDARKSGKNIAEVNPKLYQLSDSFSRVAQRCTARLQLVPHETLRWLNSVDPSKPTGAPFRVKEHEDSMYRYRQFIKRCLIYSVRTGQLGREVAQEQHGIRWTDVQWEALHAIIDAMSRSWPVPESRSEEEQAQLDAALDQVVFQYLIAISQQRVMFNVYVNPLLHFCAVLGINNETGGWSEAKNYTASLAGIVWCNRLLALEEVFKDSPEDPNEITEDMVEQFKTYQQQWLTDGTHSPFSTMIRWMAYGKGHRKQEGGMAKVLFEEDGTALRYVGQRLRIADFGDAVNAVVDEAEALLSALTFGPWEEVREMIDLHRIVDSLMYEGTDCSFATNKHNTWLQPGFQFLAERGNCELWQRERVKWNPQPVKKYLRQLHEWKSLMLVITHVWGGQPGRGPEIMTMKHCDTQQVTRNTFVFDGQLLIITDRDKSRAIRGLGKKVARFLPERLGKMMVAYIIWLLPFEEMLHDQTGIPGPPVSITSYLWKDGRKGAWKTPQLTEALSSLTGQHCGVELMTRDYRHVAIGLGRMIKGIVIRLMEVDIGDGDDHDEEEGDQKGKMEDLWDLQSTHGSAIARGHYAVDIRFPNKLQPEMVSHFREISRLWHRFLERCGSTPYVKPELTSGGSKRLVNMKGERLDHDGIVSSPLRTVQSEHALVKRGRSNTSMVSARLNPSKTRHVQAADTITVKDLRDGLQRLLGSKATWRSTEQEEAMQRIVEMRRTEGLIVVLPTGAGKSVLFMLPALLTISGTYIVVVPFSALLHDLVTRAREKGVDCIRWKPAKHQERELPQRAASLVVVSADVAATTQFFNYVDSIRARESLRGIFVDECHTIIMDVWYREKLESLQGLHRFGAPVVLLTATLPMVMERWFRQVMLVPDALIIRASTVKRNVRYRVTRIPTESFQSRSEQMQDEVVRTVLRMEKTMAGDQKGVVYCRSKPICEAMAKKLGCEFYHSGITEDGERQRRLQDWVTGESGNRWIYVTTGLGTGIDIGGIVAVIHLEQPYGMVDFIQQTGRGGRRDGEVVESVVVMDQHQASIHETRSDVEHFNHQAMEWFVDSVICRRTIIGMFMDVGLGVYGQDCEQLQGELCDQCQEKRQVQVEALGQEPGQKLTEKRIEQQATENIEEESSAEIESDEDSEEGDKVGDNSDGKEEEDSAGTDGGIEVNRWSKHTQQKQGGIRVLRWWLRENEDRCGVCLAVWYRQGRVAAWRGSFEHRISECPKMGLDELDEYRRWRRRVKFAGFRSCWKCCLRQGMCAGWNKVHGCEWGDVMMPMVMWAGQDWEWRQKISNQLDLEIKEGEREEEEEEREEDKQARQRGYDQWVVRSRRMYGETWTNAIAVWDLVVQETSSDESS